MTNENNLVIRKGNVYKFSAVLADCHLPMTEGTYVRVITMNGIGQTRTVIGGRFVYVEALDKSYTGMVCVNSLVEFVSAPLKNKRRTEARKARNEAMRACGLVSYRTESGSIRWE